jgi:hypothetical protein
MKIYLLALLYSLVCTFWSARPYPSKPARISRTIDLGNLQKILAGEKTGPLLLDIYPVKKTADPQKSDFDLAVILRQDGKKETFIDAGCNEDRFRKEAALYVHYLFQNKIPLKNIPQLYTIEMDQAQIGNRAVLEISIPLVPAPNSYKIAVFKGTRKDTRERLDSVPVCQCPPGPCTGCHSVKELKHVSFMDSTVKKQYAKIN